MRDRVVAAAFVPYIVLSVVHVIALAADSAFAGPTKLALMPLLAVPVLVAAPRIRRRWAVVLLLAAIVSSWLGDGAGAFFPGGPELPLMLLFFGLAHVAYMLLFVLFILYRPLPRWALVYAAWWVAMLAVLGPYLGVLFVAVAAYGLVLGGTAALSARCHPLVLVGGAFFLVSDTILAFRLFLPAAAMYGWTGPAVMLTYTLGQGLIVAGALRTMRELRALREPRTTRP